MSEEANATPSTHSDEYVASLVKELAELKDVNEACKKANTELKTNLDNMSLQFKNQADNLMNELDASKQMYNETLNVQYQLRTGNIALQKKIQTVMQEIAQLKESLLKKD